MAGGRLAKRRHRPANVSVLGRRLDMIGLLRNRAASTATAAFRLIPPRLRERIKAALGALGHEPGWAHRLRARSLAAGRKRLDVLVEDIIERMHVAHLPALKDKECLEYGSGHLLSEALLYHLAGARRVVAADHFRLLQEKEVPRALDGADLDILVSRLSIWDDHSAIRRRLAALRRRTDWSPAGLAEIGVEYIAPWDMGAGPLPGMLFDMISSLSVLEHVPAAAAPDVLQNLFAMLRPGGIMVHNIHLEDHRDIEGAPFAFLAADSDWTEADHDSRGNRLRASDWLRMVEAVPGARVAGIKPLIKPGTALPITLAAPFRAYEPLDLRTSRIILVVEKATGGTGR